jgi:hypothetical protein
MTNQELQITEDDIRVMLQQKVNQVTSLEIERTTLLRILGDKDQRIAELEEAANASSGSGKEKTKVSV